MTDPSMVTTVTRQTAFADLPEWLTPDEARKWLGISRSLMYSLVVSGEVESRRVGRLLRIPKRTLLGPV